MTTAAAAAAAAEAASGAGLGVGVGTTPARRGCRDSGLRPLQRIAPVSHPRAEGRAARVERRGSRGEGERMGTSMGCCERVIFGRRGMRPQAYTYTFY